ncbi:MFS transporter [Pirellulales bacterium]|nr:MFS transporter [Pirellulales bacterium]
MNGQNEFARLSESRRIFALFALIVAGESVFFLPFVLPRVFRPTILEVFGLTNYELGTAFAAYGVVAMVAYALGGPLADYFCPRKLLAIALISTSLGGVLLWRIPSLSTLKLLYAYWGFTTIALFWAALIRSTREWGGKLAQGSAFGLLDGGRGLLTAATGSCVVALYASLLPDEVESASLEVRANALQQVILILATITFFAAILIWLLLPKKNARKLADTTKWSLRGTCQIATMPMVWLQAFIIICAYAGFKATDDFSLYAKEVLQVNEVEAARVGMYSLWMRPLAAITAGFLADRFGAGNLTLVSFALLIVGSAILASETLSASMYVPYIVTIVCASLGIFALRGLYYAIMEEGQVPRAYTGSAVGLVSVVGYTPDIFMGPLMGHLLDSAPGASGHRHVFLVITAFSVAGLMASLIFIKISHQKNRAELGVAVG